MADGVASDAPEAKAPKKAKAAKATAVVKRTDLPSEQLGRLLSRLNHPVTVAYGDGHVRLPARGTTNGGLIRGLLGPLPNGVVFVADKA